MRLSLYTKVIQPMHYLCIKNVACKDTSAKRYIIENYQPVFFNSNKQQTTNNKQQTTNNKQQTTTNNQQTKKVPL